MSITLGNISQAKHSNFVMFHIRSNPNTLDEKAKRYSNLSSMVFRLINAGSQVR